MGLDYQLEKNSDLYKRIQSEFARTAEQALERQNMSHEEVFLQRQQQSERWEELNRELKAQEEAWRADQTRYQERELSKNANDKALAKAKTPEEIAQLREERRLKALKKDAKKVSADKSRHRFYKAVMGFVKFGRWISGRDKEERETTQAPTYVVPGLKEKYESMVALRAQAEQQGQLEEFEQKYGAYFDDLRVQYQRAHENAEATAVGEVDKDKTLTQEKRQAEIDKRRDELMGSATYTMTFGDNTASQVRGGTKPNAVRYAKDGSRWLVKTNHSCIGAAAPNASIMTVAGYQIQKLVHPDTAIEAFETKSQRQGTVSMQRMADHVLDPGKGEVVDLFKFSRTPESMTKQELKQVEELSPQLLREHTTDWLLANFDTKGENFIVSRDAKKGLVLRGIDKEAGGRAILDEGAQHMSKDYQKFDQDTVYNQMFRRFAEGTMNLDLSVVEAQVLRVERCSDEEYLKIFQNYIDQQKRDRPDDAPQIQKNLLRRKQGLRAEYRRFFGELVRERIKHVDAQEAAALREKYLGGTEDGIFLFKSDTMQSIQQERKRMNQLKEEDSAALQEKIEKADKEDEKKYKRRHALYDASKVFVMGAKSLFKIGQVKTEMRKTKVMQSDLRFHEEGLSEEQVQKVKDFQSKVEKGRKEALDQYRKSVEKEYVQRFRLSRDGKCTDEEIAAHLAKCAAEIRLAVEKMEASMEKSEVDLEMIDDQEIFLGGTKPMSQYIAADGSKWLAKQAVNCMGYYKPSGAILTEIGAKVQRLVDKKTAVEAFVGQTKKHGLVSFQRRLEHVEKDKKDEAGNVIEKKLDLFQFSKHPELATTETTKAVQKLMPQILREHVTDWLLCNFDTKGENFVITLNEQGERVLHGIDKEAAFNKIRDPKAQHMSTTYKPHANNTLYNVVFEKYVSGDMDFDLREVIPHVQKMIAMGDDEYMETFKPYFDHLNETKKPEVVQDIRGKILARKQGLKAEYRTFFAELIERRCKNLHPDEAAALRATYLDKKGLFKFPDA